MGIIIDGLNITKKENELVCDICKNLLGFVNVVISPDGNYHKKCKELLNTK